MKFSFLIVSSFILFLSLSYSASAFCIWPFCNDDNYPYFYLYTRNNINSPVLITESNIASTRFDFNKETKILIHGFADAAYKTDLLDTKNALLTKEDVNVIVVDWENGAKPPNYFFAKDNAKTCGERVGGFVRAAKINTKLTHCIGHSLGSHICGFASKLVRFRRITGLDPAGPLFDAKDPKTRLDKTDADFVDNIHTDSMLGIQAAIGHQDYYPNGGKSQAGCGIFRNEISDIEFYSAYFRGDLGDFFSCSHMRAIKYYSESVLGLCSYRGTLCSDYDKFEKGQCSCNTSDCVNMGHHADHKKQSEGKFYLNTHKTSPFCQH